MQTYIDKAINKVQWDGIQSAIMPQYRVSLHKPNKTNIYTCTNMYILQIKQNNKICQAHLMPLKKEMVLNSNFGNILAEILLKCS